MEWNAEKRQLVQYLWPTHSASAIATEINHRYKERCTRNSAMGIAHRLNLCNGGKHCGSLPEVNHRVARPAKPKPRPKSKPRPKPAMNHAMPPPYAPHPGNIQCPCDVIELEQHNCHWPIGDPRQPGFFFCGAVVVPDRQYCPAHLHAAHNEAAM